MGRSRSASSRPLALAPSGTAPELHATKNGGHFGGSSVFVVRYNWGAHRPRQEFVVRLMQDMLDFTQKLKLGAEFHWGGSYLVKRGGVSDLLLSLRARDPLGSVKSDLLERMSNQ